MELEYKRKLVATFTNSYYFDSTVSNISYKLTVEGDKILVFNHEPVPVNAVSATTNPAGNLILLYYVFLPKNTEKEKYQLSQKVYNTTFIHHKHHPDNTDTLFTLDGLNEAIKLQNNGMLDKNFKLNWTEYSNKLLLQRNARCDTAPISFKEIIHLKQYMESLAIKNALKDQKQFLSDDEESNVSKNKSSYSQKGITNRSRKPY